MIAELHDIPNGYKRTEAGVTPTEWNAVQLRNLTSYVSSGRTTTKAEAGTYPVYGSTGRIGWANQFEYEGDKILVARVGANAGTVNRVTGRYGVSDNTVIVECNSSLDVEFAFYQLVRQRLNDIVFGSGQPLITGTQLKDLYLPLPPTLAEQEAIAEALGDADALIESLEQLVAKKRHLKQAAMQQLLTGKTRLPGFEGDWEPKRLGDLARIQRGASPRPIDSPVWFDENSPIGWVRISDVTSAEMYLRETTQRLSPLGVQESR